MLQPVRFPAARPLSYGALALATAQNQARTLATAQSQARTRSLAPAPDPAWLRQTTVLLVEVLAGARPPRQCASVTTERVFYALARRPMPARTRRMRSMAPQVRSWRMQSVLPGAAEVTTVIQSYGRFHACAMRFDFHRGRWLCTTIETTFPP
jgi:Family of unknown function (DUF6459)